MSLNLPVPIPIQMVPQKKEQERHVNKMGQQHAGGLAGSAQGAVPEKADVAANGAFDGALT